jgi:hypothetical protein
VDLEDRAGRDHLQILLGLQALVDLAGLESLEFQEDLMDLEDLLDQGGLQVQVDLEDRRVKVQQTLRGLEDQQPRLLL